MPSVWSPSPKIRTNDARGSRKTYDASISEKTPKSEKAPMSEKTPMSEKAPINEKASKANFHK